MSPVFRDEKTNTWWYVLHGKDFGPHDTEEQAWEAYNAHVGILSGSCPTCED